MSTSIPLLTPPPSSSTQLPSNSTEQLRTRVRDLRAKVETSAQVALQQNDELVRLRRDLNSVRKLLVASEARNSAHVTRICTLEAALSVAQAIPSHLEHLLENNDNVIARLTAELSHAKNNAAAVATSYSTIEKQYRRAIEECHRLTTLVAAQSGTTTAHPAALPASVAANTLTVSSAREMTPPVRRNATSPMQHRASPTTHQAQSSLGYHKRKAPVNAPDAKIAHR